MKLNHKQNCNCGMCKAIRGETNNKNNFNFKYDISKKEIYELYWDKEMSGSEIAKIFNCHPATIRSKMIKYNISRRTLKKAIMNSFDKGRNPGNYVEGKTLKKVYCIDCGKLLSKLAYYNETKRCLSCVKKGELHPNWNNGSSFEPYPLGWTKTYKEQIRYRDRYKCQICGCPEVENGRRLDIHHIDYDKTNISSNNLVSLCRSCHMKTNHNREDWIEYFKIKVRR